MPTLQDLQRRLLAFRDARDWQQFHTPRQLAAPWPSRSAMLWETDDWVVNLEHVHETSISRIKGRAARNPASQDYADVLDAVTSAYRILLTRAIKGLFVWCEDEETRGYLEAHLQQG